jgi:ABC-type multidrug transport system ATPase subunit
MFYSHRLSTILNADRIVVLENGRIIETGHHNELIRANARYANLWSKQVATPPQADDHCSISKDDDKNLVNDLSADETTQELLKLGSPCKQSSEACKEDDQKPEEQATLHAEVSRFLSWVLRLILISVYRYRSLTL